MRTIVAGLLCAAAFACAVCGCASLNKPPWSEEAWFAAKPPADSKGRTVESERARYQTDHDSNAARWLLAHAVSPRMTVSEVAGVFGVDGERVYEDGWVKKGPSYREDDATYRWGPDNTGHTIYLVFREGHLTNFDPDELR